MAHIVMAYIVIAYKVMAHIVMAYTGMAYIVMAYRVMAYRVMAHIVMTPYTYGPIYSAILGASLHLGQTSERGSGTASCIEEVPCIKARYAYTNTQT